MNSRRNPYILALAAVLCLAGTAFAAVELTLAPRAMSHTQEISSGSAQFNIDVAGKTPPVNVGITIEGPAKNLRLSLEGALDFSSIDALANSIIRPGMSDEEKVRAIFYFAAQSLYDRGGNGCDDPLEYVNLWGFSWCGNYAMLLNDLWKSAGFPTVFLNPVLSMPGGHTISGIFYDNQWHMYDARLRGYFLNRDNRTVASMVELDKDDDLIRRGLDYEGRLHYHWPFSSIMYNYMNAANDWYDGFNAHYDNEKLFNARCPVWDKSVNLHAGETLYLAWDNSGKWWSRKDLSPRWLKEHSEGQESITMEPLIYANGTLTCVLDPRKYKDQPLKLDGIRVKNGVFTPQKTGQTASMTYRIRTPYFIPSLSVEANCVTDGSPISVEISTDEGASWLPVWRSEGTGEFKIDLATEETQRVTWYSENKYGCLVRFSMPRGGDQSKVALSDIKLTADLFYRPMILPALKTGTNRLVWQDDSRGRHKRKVTFQWLEDNNVLLSHDDPAEDDPVEITALVTNNGNSVAENVKVRFFDSNPEKEGRQIGQDITVASIAAGETAEVSTSWNAVQYQPDAGTGVSIGSGKERKGYISNTIHVVADPDNQLAETNEANNHTSRPLVVYSKAELVLKDPSFVTFSQSNDKVTITALVRNQNLYGHITRAREARDVRVRFYDSQPLYGRMDENMIGEVIIPSIPPGEFGVARVDWDVSGLSGNRQVFVAVDPLDEIPEHWQSRRGRYSLIKKDIDLSMKEFNK
jgi:hypothetical protein